MTVSLTFLEPCLRIFEISTVGILNILKNKRKTGTKLLTETTNQSVSTFYFVALGSRNFCETYVDHGIPDSKYVKSKMQDKKI